jgi:peptidoglycan/LPS O-acetylase OafA/YrhL
MIYRPDIDGLRAVAVISVLLYHAGFAAFSGGFIGVDVFFVISGYLIAGVLWREIAGGSFSILGFYERRARRILPALFAVILFSALVGAVLFTPEEMTTFARSVLGSVLFVQNFVLGMEAGYFDAASETKPLLHIWSLSVEEQFYILFPPLLVLAALWLNRVGVLSLMAGVFALSLAGSVALMEARPVYNFYMLPLRAWELLAGAMLAVAVVGRPAGAGRLHDAVSVAGLASILLAALLYTTETPFPGYTALQPVAGAVALIWAGPHSLVGRLLSWRPLVFIGLISYSLYLWHWPLIAYHALLYPDGPPFWHAGGILALSLALAVVSWRFVERPFRNKDGAWRSRGLIFGASAAGIGIFAVLAFSVIVGAGWPWRASDEAVRLAAVAYEKQISDNHCQTDISLFSLRGRERGLCRMGQKGESPPRVLVWGDSHVGAWYPMLDAVLSEGGLSAAGISMAGCPIAFGLERAELDKGGCAEGSASIRAYIETSDLDHVILVGSWFGALTTKNTVYAGQRSHDADTRRQNVTRALIDTAAALREMGVTSTFVMTVPGSRHSVPEALFRRMQLGGYPEIRRTAEEYDAIFAGVAATAHAEFDHVIETSDLLCETGHCAVQHDGNPLYYDGNHPSLYLNDLLLGDFLTRFAPILKVGDT